MKLLLIFIALNVVNVILQTFKSIATVKGSKLTASAVNALAYGLYTIVLVYMNCDLELWQKVLVVGGANFIGVYVVKFLEQKARKDKLWKVEATIHQTDLEKMDNLLDELNLSHNVFLIDDNYCAFNIYCPSQKESHLARECLSRFNAKYFVSESKSL